MDSIRFVLEARIDLGLDRADRPIVEVDAQVFAYPKGFLTGSQLLEAPQVGEASCRAIDMARFDRSEAPSRGLGRSGRH